MKNQAFSLMEMLVVLMIIGVLSTLGITQYTSFRERTLDDEARSNLRLILAAERVSKMEDINSPTQYQGPLADINAINNTLRLAISSSNSAWTYNVKVYSSNAQFCAQATRFNPPPGRARNWIIQDPVRAGVADPQPVLSAGGCS